MAKNRFSKAWIHAHLNDPYVKLAQQRKYRSRAAFKLIEIDEQDRLIRPGQTIVDLGSAPGSWSQVLREKLAGPGGTVNGRIVAIDVLPMEPVDGVVFLQGDFRDDAVLAQFEALLEGRKADLVLSDMAPNISGIASMDQARAVNLAELALEFARGRLAPGGAFLVKTFQGAGYPDFRAQMMETFRTVASRKPAASRDRSSEQFLLGRQLKRPAGG